MLNKPSNVFFCLFVDFVEFVSDFNPEAKCVEMVNSLEM